MNTEPNQAEKVLPDSSEQVTPKTGLPKPPLFTSDYIAMAEILEFALDRFGRLVLALMYYTMDGTMPDDLPPDLKMMFGIYQRKVDAARDKYSHVCSVRAESGAKGGKQKAANAQKKSAGAKFNPPTQKQFRDAVEHFIDNGEISEDTTDYDADSFFDKLRDAGWTIGGAPIQSRTDWEMAIKAKFFEFNIASVRHLYYPVFSAVFADFCTGDGTRGAEWADNATYDFMETYDEDSKCWVIQGKKFHAAQWRDALAWFMEQYSESSNP